MSRVIENQLAGRVRTRDGSLGFLFKPKVIISLVLIGIFSFAALIALSGYAGDLRKDTSGNATATSQSAIGYAGYVQLLKDLGYEVNLAANPATPTRSWETAPLRIYSLKNTFQSETLKELMDDEAKLIILPKWRRVRHPEKAGWIEKPYQLPTYTSTRLSSLLQNADIELEISHASDEDKIAAYDLQFVNDAFQGAYNDETDDSTVENIAASDKADDYALYAINSTVENLQFFDFPDDTQKPDIILTADSSPILIRLSDTQTYILSEPDLFNTHGISTQSRARLAVNIVDLITNYEGLEPYAIDFDLSIHGLGGGRNIIKLMTLPPFLAATLCLLAAGGIVAWQAFSRFGDPIRREPDFAQGPVSLAKSAAEFMYVSNRTQHMAPDYTQLTRQYVIRKMGLVGQSQEHINMAIRAREKQREITPSFDMLHKAQQDNPQTNLITHARAMVRWKKEMIS